MAIRCTLTLPPGTTATIDMVVGIGIGRDGCDELIAKYRDRRLADRVFELAWTHSRGVSTSAPSGCPLYERLAGLIIYPHRALRADTQVLLQNRRGQSGLWGQSISGDHPIALVRITDAANVDLVRQMVQAHAYLRLKGVIVDLVIWNDEQGGYRQQLHDEILGLIAAGMQESLVDRPAESSYVPATVAGGPHPAAVSGPRRRQRRPKAASPNRSAGDLRRSDGPEVHPPARTRPPSRHRRLEPDAATADLSGHNGLGGFSADGREYIIDLHVGQTTPAPWSNVIANATFGCVVSDSTPGYMG